MSAHYARRDYWEHRFESESSYEWLCDWASLRGQLLPLFCNAARVLVLGNGTSRLPLDIATEVLGARVLSSDYSSVATANMRKLWSPENTNDEAAARVEWCEADMLALEDSEAVRENAPFDIIIDKGALDAVLADGGDTWAPSAEALASSRTICDGVFNMLSPGGVYAIVSFAQPVHRLQHLLQRDASTGASASPPVQQKILESPAADDEEEWEADKSPDIVPGAAQASTDCKGTLWASASFTQIDAGLGYYLYTLRKAAVPVEESLRACS
jgi:hypothetical protein